ncbi:ABC transporter ATP-binding protein [Fusobacterium nucleatum]|uniref:ABC transporter ATP-binding protein n=1 Tax=Fusobacterium nucleatum TaxID=851 RepID=A0A3P1VTZ8_FUSNU|nr:ABC transporter ATP-binding protein [Fusobacterium nucleatum]RRD36926.1 ABC transporter ATP-binding protein [Fusobacterium nucleatum]
MKNFFKSIIFLIILLLSFQYYEKQLFKRFDILIDYAYYKIPKDSLDLLFVGSSHSYCTFNTRLFDHYLKCNSLNLGTSSQSFSITYSGILEILKRQTPKVIVIEVYPIKREPSVPALRPHLDTMNFSINKLRLIMNSLPISKWGNHLLTTTYYHSRWKEFYVLKNTKDKDYGEYGKRLENKGFSGYNYDFIRNTLHYNIYEKDWNKTFNPLFNIDNNSLNLLESLFKICKEKGIKVILTSPPVIEDSNTLSILYNLSLKNLMNKYDVNTVDFNDGTKKYERICFLDDEHVSLAGADEVSFKMANYLKENYPILLNTKNYEDSDRSPEYYFYSENIENDNNFQIFNLELELEEGVIVNSLKIYKNPNNNFDLFFEINENKSSNKIYDIALNEKEVAIELEKIQLNFKTIKNDKEEFPKYYIRQIKGKKYIYKKNIEIPKKSKYYF